MKNLTHLALALFLLVAVNQVVAQNRPLGVGLIIGEPTGLSVKLWTSSATAWDMGLGWSVSDRPDGDKLTRIHLHIDYLRHAFNALNTAESLPLYYGFGGRFIGGSGDDGSLALRSVLGLAWQPHQTPLDLFVEIAPSLQIVPSSTFQLDAAIGFRYFL
ncbi:MAG: hypothetical protein K9N29_10620 [Candidatus Marinimicrobia bacterium]|nr:hypothetical protein [Candidatus Neomarinimicrobiota bacterium]